MACTTACLNYGLNYGDVDKGHRANGFTTDGGFAEYAVNNINTLIAIPDSMSDAEATLVVYRRHCDVRADRTRRAGGRRGCGRVGAGTDRIARRRGGQGVGGVAGSFSPGPATTACKSAARWARIT